MNASIDDEAARAFSAQFYSAIGFGKSVQEAGKARGRARGPPGRGRPRAVCTLRRRSERGPGLAVARLLASRRTDDERLGAVLARCGTRTRWCTPTSGCCNKASPGRAHGTCDLQRGGSVEGALSARLTALVGSPGRARVCDQSGPAVTGGGRVMVGMDNPTPPTPGPRLSRGWASWR